MRPEAEPNFSTWPRFADMKKISHDVEATAPRLDGMEKYDSRDRMTTGDRGRYDMWLQIGKARLFLIKNGLRRLYHKKGRFKRICLHGGRGRKRGSPYQNFEET